jgi:exodeoxyribonuclease V gamma subunit
VPGLPDPRTQGRGALLDLVAGTTRHLLVSWTGSDPHTGEYLSPCPAVGDLLEVLSAQTGVPVRDLVQPIGLDQVPPGPWPSPARRAQSQARRTPLPDASALVPPAPLPPPGQSWCGIDEIFRDLADPPTAWLRRLGIRLEEVTDPPADHERLRLDDGLENWRLRDAIVQARRDARDLEELLDRWEAEGSIPRRAWGRGKVATLVRQADRLVEGTADLWRQVRQEPRGLTLPVGGMTVSGVIARHHPEHGPVLQHAGAGGARFRLRVWLQGLCWQAAGHRGGGLLLALDQRKERCVPVDLPAADSPIEAAERLGRVLDCWRQIRSRPRPWPAEVLSAWADGEDDDPAVRDAQARIAWMKGGSGGWSQGPAGQPAAVRLWPEGEDAWTHAAIELADYAESMGVWQWSRSPRSPAPDDAGQAAPAARSAPAKKRKAR